MFALQGEEDGPVVAAMLGVTNVSELGMWSSLSSPRGARHGAKLHGESVKRGEAVRHQLNDLLLVKPFNFAYTGIFNILVTQVPVGLSSSDLPLGVQVVAGKNMDRISLAVAEEAEMMFGGWVPPSLPA